LQPFVPADAGITLYRPQVGNVFDLEPGSRARDGAAVVDPSRPLRVVSVGTVEPRKNYAAAAAIVERLQQLCPAGAELHIVGRPGWGDAMQTLARAPHVTVHGFLPPADAKRIIEAADVYLCTSHDEGLGLPLLEAQYAGLPVVAPDAAVFREVLGPSGIFIDPVDAHAAAVRIWSALAGLTRSHAATEALANVARWNGVAAQDAERAGNLVAGRAATPADRNAPVTPTAARPSRGGP
jgi:glycosyltransferase involved in cell wall biosynthesis